MRDPREPLTIDATAGEIMQRGLAIAWDESPSKTLDVVMSALLAEVLTAVRAELASKGGS